MTDEEFDDLRLAIGIAREYQTPSIEVLRRRLRIEGLSSEAIERALFTWGESLRRQGIAR